jgi:tetratricopeptide (TPR) repeat protein
MLNPILRVTALSPLLLSGFLLPAFPVVAQTSPIAEEIRPGESPYDGNMRLGFAAMDRKDYQGAVNYFREALFSVPEDREATIAYWNARKALHDSTSITDRTPRESAYDRSMRLGYDEVHKRDYQSALINFNRALEERPGDHYASLALRNVTAYIAAQKGQPLSNIEQISLNVADNHYAGESAYDRYMRLGYAAAQEKQWATAADYFRSALYDRPDDRLATIAFWNVKHHLNKTGGSPQRVNTIETYNRSMRLGYDAVHRHHFQAALPYFEAALKVKPGDEYATQAIRNVQTYIQQGN